MRDVPILNLALEVEAVGFRIFEGGVVGVLITPWFMNLIFLPDNSLPKVDLVTGITKSIDFPCGEIDFLTAADVTIGSYLSCSLFSPVFEFQNMDLAREVAEKILNELFAPKVEVEESQALPSGILAKMEQPVSRRGFLGALLGPARCLIESRT